jgi:type III secretion protein SpaR/YscT/HrcT
MPLTDFLLGFGVCCVRPAVALQMLPFGASNSAGTYLRTPLTLVMAWIGYDGVSTFEDPVLPLILKEAALGVVLGFLLNRSFAAVGMAGALLAQQAGYTSGATYDPNFDREASPIESFLMQLLTLLAFSPAGLHLLLGAVRESFVLWPAAQAAPDFSPMAGQLMAEYAGVLMQLSLQLAMPVLVFLLLAEICLGIVGRHAQQLNPYSTAMPVKAAILFAALWGGFSILLQRLFQLLETAHKLLEIKP